MTALLQQLGAALLRHDEAAIAVVKRLIANRGPLGEQWRAVGKMMLRIGELEAANAAMALLVEQNAGASRARFAQARMFARTGQIERAWHAAADLDGRGLDPFKLHCFRGELQVARGAFADARAWLLRALDVRPGSGEAWLMLAMAVRLDRDGEVAERLFRAEAAFAQAPADDAAMYDYALGKAYADRGDHRRAYAAFARGAAIQGSLRGYAAAADRASADAALRGYDRRYFAALAPIADPPTRRPILVTGLPRSGTTLVEQILASHSGVAGGDELGLFGALVHRLGGADAGSLGDWLAQGRSRAELSRRYLYLLDQRFGPAGRVVDKTLEASRYLGLAASLLPDAPILWIRRDPLDNAWSIFRTFLAQGGPWTWDLGAIGHHFRIEDELAERWQDMLGDRLLTIRYEDLVDRSEETIPRLLRHCGLPPEAAVFAPHRARRAVTTFSAAQVREPINRDGIGSAAPYRAFLQPFVEAYRAGPASLAG